MFILWRLFDKAVMDAVLGGVGCRRNLDRMLSEVHRVLKPNGRYLLFTHGAGSIRRQFLEQTHFNWQVVAINVGAPSLYSAYMATKGRA